MSKLAIVDLDGVIADSTARFERATIDGKINWKVAFDPELVELDTLIDGVDERLYDLEIAGYTVVFLTSRPETMERATLNWLNRYDVLSIDRRLITKPLSEQFTKTKVWKACEVARLIREHKPERTIFVEDEIANVEEVARQLPDVQCFLKLEDAK